MLQIGSVAIDMAPIVSVAVQALAMLLLTIATVAVPMIAGKILTLLRLQGDEKARTALETALTNGINLTAARIQQAKAAGIVLSPEAEKQELIAGAKAYAAPKVPEAIARLKVAGHLDEVIEARVAAPKPDATVTIAPGGGAAP
jgi:hypothetical protein